ncbi:Uncharacterised protein [Mycobacteroides abscessus subsp. bolletii]|uniref:hypothetical protein n=1 Tax=Mycobacteroides abscessus TaxID=36809 RepID=UPI0009A700B3|nr:hypothetical protein [Mycobacteroides abscessus]SLF47148.1 Uncharacterised protein [Mycobacteroides abscessus subsp. bolletii]
MTARPETLEAALAALDRVSADRDRLLQKLDDEPDSKKHARDLQYLVQLYLGNASSDGERAAIVNLAELLRTMSAAAEALATEIKHYADAECAAWDERDELQERVAELSDEIADLRTRECARSVIL